MIVFPTSYLPPISYFCHLLLNNKQQDGSFVLPIEQHETYPKQTLRNRCEIAGSNGMQSLSVPICHAPKRTTPEGLVLTTQQTHEVRINYQTPWQHQHWMALVSAYQHTPFFFYYQDLFRPIYETHYDYLLQWNNALMEVVLQLLGLPAHIELTTHWQRADEQVFDVLPTSNMPYWQIFADKNGFIPNLSIADLLFNEGPDATNYLYRYAEKS